MGIYHPQQIEFARLNINYTVMSKRFLRRLVQEGRVRGWDDPRMPTLSGMRRRGYTPEAIRKLCDLTGVSKSNSVVDIALLEHCLRDHLNLTSARVMAVLRPLKVVIDNYPEGQVEWMEAINNPEDPAAGTRQIPFSRELYIEQEDFMEDAPSKFYRLAPGREVRLRYAYFIKCVNVVKDASGQIVELHCTYDPETRGGDAPDGRKVKATLHWVSAAHALPAEARLYSTLFDTPEPGSDGRDFIDCLNPNSLEVIEKCWVEPSLAAVKAGDRFQFERVGYFNVDLDSTPEHLVFNRTVTLRDDWAKIQQKSQPR